MLAGAVFAPTFTTYAETKRHVIKINKMKFGPAPGQIRVGDQITWKNIDLVTHTATARDGSFDIELPRGAEHTITIKTQGAVEVYCRYHPGMIVTIVAMS